MKLGALLIRDRVVTSAQCAEALRAQVLYGGRIGSNLIELKHVDIQKIGDYLARQHDVPCATEAMFQKIEATTLALIEPQMARQFMAVPLRKAQALEVALADPRDPDARQALASATGLEIAPHVAAELRLAHYVERLYRLRRAGRMIRIAPRGAAERQHERRRQQPADGIEIAKKLVLAPGSRQSPGDRKAPAPVPAQSLGDIGAALELALQREEVAAALLDFAPGRFEAFAILVVREQNAFGWRAYSRAAPEPPDVRSLLFGLGGSSVFQAAKDRQQLFRGPAPKGGRPAETRLWKKLGGDEPAEVVVAPVVVAGNITYLLYAHGPERDACVGEISELAARMGEAMQRLHQAVSV